MVQVLQFRIVAADQVELPVSVPVLKLLFPLYGVLRAGIGLGVNEFREVVAFRKAFDLAPSVLADALPEFARDADVKHGSSPVHEDVDPVLV